MLFAQDVSPLGVWAVVLAIVSLAGTIATGILAYLNKRDERSHDTKLLLMERDIEQHQIALAQCERDKIAAEKRCEALEARIKALEEKGHDYRDSFRS